MSKYNIGQDFSNLDVNPVMEINQYPELQIISSVQQIHEHNRAVPWGVKTGGSIGSEVLVWKGIAYFGSNDHNLYAIDIRNMKLIWKYGINDLVSLYSSPVIHKDSIIFTGYNGSVYCIDMQGIKLNWKFSASDRTISTPLIRDGKLYFGSKDGNFYCIDAGNGKLIWRIPVGHEVNNSPVCDNSGLFFCTRNALVKASFSGHIIWKVPMNGDVCYLKLCNKELIFGSTDRNIYCVTTAGKIKWKHPTRGPVIMRAAVKNGKIFIGSNDWNMYCLDMLGNLNWKYPVGDYMTTECLVLEDRIMFGSFDKNLYFLDFKGKLVRKKSLEFVIFLTKSGNRIYASGWDCRMHVLDLEGNKVWDYKTSMGNMSEVVFEPLEEIGVEVVHIMNAPEEKEEGNQERFTSSYGDFKGQYIGGGMKDYIGKEIDDGSPGMKYKGKGKVYR